MTKRKILSHCNVQVLHCPECFYMSLSLSKMGEHFFTHQESVEWQIYKCNYCGLISSHDDLLNEHILLKHKDTENITIGKKLLIDSLFIPELPESYSCEKELTPESYKIKYMCPFCEVCSTDKEVFRMHLGINHNIINVDNLDAFVNTDDKSKNNVSTIVKKPPINTLNTSCFDCVPDYKKLKIEETMPRVQTVIVKEENVSNSKASQFQSVLYNFNVVAEKIVVNYTQPVPDDPTKVIICASDPDLKLEVNRDIILQSYDPEPLRFLRNVVRQGIPVDELINFSWKGNRRGRPRLVNESPSNPTMERKSMKDDRRMKSFCKLVEEVSKKPLPDNLGTYMHQFLSNLRNKNAS